MHRILKFGLRLTAYSLVLAAHCAAQQTTLLFDIADNTLKRPTPAQFRAANLDASYQPLDADLTTWAAITRASGFDTFAVTPTSANLDSLVTDDTGSGALVFATSPTLVTPVLGAATGTSIALSDDSIIGGTGPLQRLHIKTNSTLPGLVAGNMGHTYYGLVVESEDATLGLASRNEGGHGSGLDLMEVNSGTLADKWWIGRLASGMSPSSALVMAYGTVADYALATEYFKLLKTGELTLPAATQKLTVAATALNGTITLGTAGTSTILTDTSDGADTKRISIGGGGTNSTTRGAYINLMGNEYSGQEGDLSLLAGEGSLGRIRFFTGATVERLAIDKTGLITTPAGTTPFGNDVSITEAGNVSLQIKTTGSGNAPYIDLWDSADASANLGRYRIVVTGSTTTSNSTLQIQSRTDADGFTANMLTITRAGALSVAATVATAAGIAWDFGAANSVSPTSPNRTLTVVVAGTTYYIAAKTTND